MEGVHEAIVDRRVDHAVATAVGRREVAVGRLVDRRVGRADHDRVSVEDVAEQHPVAVVVRADRAVGTELAAREGLDELVREVLLVRGDVVGRREGSGRERRTEIKILLLKSTSLN